MRVQTHHVQVSRGARLLVGPQRAPPAMGVPNCPVQPLAVVTRTAMRGRRSNSAASRAKTAISSAWLAARSWMPREMASRTEASDFTGPL
ncbi:hypothetical protein ACLEPN_23615 [Myxococcus sp. 1LA]